jgi:ferrous iron transport protein B
MSSCHENYKEFELKNKNIILVGNPNAGKSVFFHKLTGMYTNVSNYPGTTLQIIQGTYEDYTVVDSPGVYGLSSISLEEEITKKIVLKADKILNVVNALHLERELFLTLQLIDMGFPVVVALNFMDEVEKSNAIINIKELSKRLGVKVIPTVAIKGEGISEIKSSLSKVKPSKIQYDYNKGLPEHISKIKKRSEYILAIEGDPEILKKNGCNLKMSPDEVYQKRRKRVDEIVTAVQEKQSKDSTFKRNLSSLMIHPLFGFVFLAFIMYLAYQIVGVFVAQTVVGFTEETIMLGHYTPLIQKFMGLFHLPSWLNYVLVGEFGVLTMPVNYIVGLLLPLVVSFYLLLSVLEDSGYLPRLAFLMDKFLNRVGLNGKAIIPIILGFGCVTMATITTRMLDTEREKTISCTLLNFAIPCSAQLAVITALIATAGGFFTLVYVSIIFACFVILGTVLHKSLPGISSSLILSLPSLQIPLLKNILLKTFERTKHFLIEAGVWFFMGALIISTFQLTGILEMLQNVISPIVTQWMGLPKEAAIGYIMGIVRRDFGAAAFFSLSLTSLQLLVALVSITLFVPCIAAILILYKERGAKIATGIWVGTIITAFIVGGLINQVVVLFNGF